MSDTWMTAAATNTPAPTLEDIKKAAAEFEQIAEKHRRELATTLMTGFQLIPSPYLRDNQMIVSEAVYAAAMKLGGKS